MRGDTECISVFSPNAGEYRPKNVKYGHFSRSDFVPAKREIQFNLFHSNDLFQYLLKRSENQKFFDVFRGYKRKRLAWNRLKPSQIENSLREQSQFQFIIFFMTRNILQIWLADLICHVNCSTFGLDLEVLGIS